MTDLPLTIIVRDARNPDLDWSYTPPRGESFVFMDSVTASLSALTAAASLGLDIRRLVVDRATTPEEFLQLLAVLPPDFRGDALWIREDGAGVISAASRGDGRSLHSIVPYDVRFYLETLGLVTGRMSLEKIA
jgi:hypothetical protein